MYSLESAINHLEEGIVVGSDEGATFRLGVDNLTVSRVVLLSLKDSSFQAASKSLIFVDVVGETAGLRFFDLLDRSIDLRLVTSSSSEFELHRVGCIRVDSSFRHGVY